MLFVWGFPFYKRIRKNEAIDKDIFILAPKAYFSFYLVLNDLPLSNDVMIYEGYQT